MVCLYQERSLTENKYWNGLIAAEILANNSLSPSISRTILGTLLDIKRLAKCSRYEVLCGAHCWSWRAGDSLEIKSLDPYMTYKITSSLGSNVGWVVILEGATQNSVTSNEKGISSCLKLNSSQWIFRSGEILDNTRSL